MSDLHATTYDYAVAVTPSDSVNDPAGPFAGLLVDTAGTLKITPRSGPSATLTIKVVAGQIVPFPVLRVWSTGTVNAVVFGLVGGIVRQGP